MGNVISFKDLQGIVIKVTGGNQEQQEGRIKI